VFLNFWNNSTQRQQFSQLNSCSAFATTDDDDDETRRFSKSLILTPKGNNHGSVVTFTDQKQPRSRRVVTSTDQKQLQKSNRN
jgi:hypothetical protein